MPLTLERGVILPRLALKVLTEARSYALPHETGGFLIGKRRGAHIEVTQATFQGEDDVASRASFERADRKHADAVHATWQATGGEESLVGDWHTHPCGEGDASGQDRRAWRKLVEATRADCVGVILAAPEIPKLYLARRRGPLISIDEYGVVSEDVDDLIFGSR